LDQGFAAGSGQGTLHHLGYSMRNFYTGPIIMKQVLKEAGLDKQMQQAMRWFCGAGEVCTAPKELGMDIDAFNTSLMGRFASAIMLEDGGYKKTWLTALSRWVDNGFKYTEGTNPAFKRDGCVVHHRKCYPEYAIGGFKGSVNAIWMLAGTEWAVSQESHEIQKEALMTMRFYSQLRSFPLAMSGRHPDGTRSLIASQFALLADAGSPDGTEKIDTDLAQAYLRLNGTSGKWGQKFTVAGLEPEKTPAGGKYLPYNCSLSYRQDEWLLTFAGHSRYLWAAETYQRENHYGRYLTHGSMQLLCGKDSFDSGYRLEGWDWCHIPGTTAAERPMEEMKANVLNVDEFSGYEEMLLSDEWFAGGVSYGTEAAMFSMKLHEHDKYNGSLRARKSFFAFGNRIVCLGDGLENALEGSELHTTLFQNSIEGEDAAPSMDMKADDIVLTDKFSNAYFIRNAHVRVTKGLQQSYHEETDAPTEGYFEKAYIKHGENCSGGRYEYMAVIAPTKTDMASYEAERPYSVLRADSQAHIVKDNITGITGCSAFETVSVDENIVSLSPSVMMYKASADQMTISISNPDLALYEGESDEIFDENGKRKERSVYGRSWVANPAHPTFVEIVLNGTWNVEGDCKMQVTYDTNRTIIKIETFESRTEALTLKINTTN
jgi:chondroitin-sulfate-ABC endolyase/exolyase